MYVTDGMSQIETGRIRDNDCIACNFAPEILFLVCVGAIGLLGGSKESSIDIVLQISDNMITGNFMRRP